MRTKIALVIAMLVWVFCSTLPAAYAEMDMKDAHQSMERVMRDCGALSQNLKAMFEQSERAGAVSSPQQTAEIQKHQAMMKRLLDEMTVHMEAEVKMLEEMKANGLWHDGHH